MITDPRLQLQDCTGPDGLPFGPPQKSPPDAAPPAQEVLDAKARDLVIEHHLRHIEQHAAALRKMLGA